METRGASPDASSPGALLDAAGCRVSGAQDICGQRGGERAEAVGLRPARKDGGGREGRREGTGERRRVLGEEVARGYFRQLVAAVEHAHKKLVRS